MTKLTPDDLSKDQFYAMLALQRLFPSNSKDVQKIYLREIESMRGIQDNYQEVD